MLFTQLMNPLTGTIDKVKATVFAIDSGAEIRLGVGRNFAPQKKIGKR